MTDTPKALAERVRWAVQRLADRPDDLADVRDAAAAGEVALTALCAAVETLEAERDAAVKDAARLEVLADCLIHGPITLTRTLWEEGVTVAMWRRGRALDVSGEPATHAVDALRETLDALGGGPTRAAIDATRTPPEARDG